MRLTFTWPNAAEWRPASNFRRPAVVRPNMPNALTALKAVFRLYFPLTSLAAMTLFMQWVFPVPAGPWSIENCGKCGTVPLRLPTY